MSAWSGGLRGPNDFTMDQLLGAHGYDDRAGGTEQERLMQVFKDLARTRAELAVHAMALTPSQRASVDQGIRDLLDK